MARFRFRLEKILGLRERAEKEAARRLGEFLSRRQACLADMERMEAERRALLQRRSSMQRGRVHPASLNQNRYQLIVLERAVGIAGDRLRALDEEVRAAREVLAERSRERRLIEKLKERRRLEFEEEERRRERRELDDMPRPGRGTAIAMNPPGPSRG